MKDPDLKNQLGEIANLALDCMGVAVSIIDKKGELLYDNRQSAKLLDRKPEYIGTDIHSHHKNAKSNRKMDRMLREFEKGRQEPFH
jgi:hypothetical protein